MQLFKLEYTGKIALFGECRDIYIKAGSLAEARKFLDTMGLSALLVGYQDPPPVDSTVLNAA